MSDLSELIAELENADDDATIEIAAETLADGLATREGLAKLCDHGEPSVRRAATLAVGRRADPEDRRLLELRLEDDHPQVRRAACVALSKLALPESLGALSQALEDRLGSVRQAAAEALAAFPAARVIGLLEQLLKRDRSLFPRRAAVESLARVAARDPLVSAQVAEVLACAIPREDDDELASLATTRLVEVANDLDRDQLLAALREVPRSGRGPLADALFGSAVPLPAALASLVPQLRHQAPDPEVLSRFGSDLTRRAKEGELDRAHGREAELKAIRDRLSRPGPKSLVLVGPSGVGKTAIIHELARGLASEPVLVPMVVHEATSGEVLSGTRYLGEWQTRVKELQGALLAPSRAIWYMPDVNRLIDAGTSEHSDESFASMLAPSLERGEIIIIGESTREALRRGLDRTPRISKLFRKIRVEPPSSGETLELLGQVADDMVADRAPALELRIPPAAVEMARDLADDYLPAQARPGNAVHLLREAVSASVQEAEEEEREGPVEVSAQRVLETLSQLSGVPLRLLDDTVPLDLSEVRRFFNERVLGQDMATETVVDLISLIKTGLTDPTRPLGVLFFVGPTGVGKTEMAKTLAEFIFGSRERLVRVDLGEFRDPISLRRLVGDPHAPERASRSGLLTAPVRERPFSVVLLDEVEKAHHNVFDLLLPLMDEGRLVDEQGRVTDFRRTIVIMTSNLGSDLSEDAWLGFASSAEDPEDARGAKVQRMMEETFRPEFLNRLSKTVVFSPLSLEVMRRLARREVRRVLSRRGITRRSAIIETDDSVIGILLQEGFSSRYGARPLKRRVEELLLKPLARAILQLRPDDEAVIRLGVQEERLVSEVVFQQSSDESVDDELPVARRATARIKDPRLGRLVSLDDLEERVLDLAEQVEGMVIYLEEQRLRERKAELLSATQEADFWSAKDRARGILSEIAALERTLETPKVLESRIQRLDRLFEAARRQPGESRILHDLLVKIDALAHKIEFTNYTLRCPSPVERGEAYLHFRRVGDGAFPRDTIRELCEMYRKYVKSKGFGFRVIYEAVTRRGWLREVGVRVEGLCAYGLLRGEAGLHQWIERPNKRNKHTVFVRVSVIPPAEPLREVSRERRSSNEAGVLLRKHRQHLVLTHRETMVALDGSVDGRAEAEEDALAFLAARVAWTRGSESEGGVVRRYVLSHQPTVRDLPTNIKEHLDPVLDGRLDGFVLPRILGEG